MALRLTLDDPPSRRAEQEVADHEEVALAQVGESDGQPLAAGGGELLDRPAATERQLAIREPEAQWPPVRAAPAAQNPVGEAAVPVPLDHVFVGPIPSQDRDIQSTCPSRRALLIASVRPTAVTGPAHACAAARGIGPPALRGLAPPAATVYAAAAAPARSNSNTRPASGRCTPR